MKTFHRAYGEVQVISRFSSHCNIQTTQGIRQCHESQLTEIQDEGQTVVSTEIVPTPTESKVGELFYINTATPAELSKKFGQLGKLKAKQITERAPYESVEDMKAKLSHVFDNPEIIETLASQMRFDYPDRQPNLPSPAADAPIESA